MESYQQTADVFAFVADFHEQMRKIYRRIKDESDRKRVELLLEHLSRHEKRFERAFSKAAEGKRTTGEGKALRATWIQYVPREEYLNTEGLEISLRMNVDQVVELALELDDRLVRFFGSLASKANLPPEVRTAFKRMREQEEQEKKKTVDLAERLKKL
jgi:hypothetical protein